MKEIFRNCENELYQKSNSFSNDFFQKNKLTSENETAEFFGFATSGQELFEVLDEKVLIELRAVGELIEVAVPLDDLVPGQARARLYSLYVGLVELLWQLYFLIAGAHIITILLRLECLQIEFSENERRA